MLARKQTEQRYQPKSFADFVMVGTGALAGKLFRPMPDHDKAHKGFLYLWKGNAMVTPGDWQYNDTVDDDGWPASPSKYMQEIQPIKERTAYKYGYRLFATARAAAKAQAWHMILIKYGSNSEQGGFQSTRHAAGMECDCADYDEDMGDGQVQRRYEICPLHNRYDGYFKRLNARLTQAILKHNNL